MIDALVTAPLQEVSTDDHRVLILDDNDANRMLLHIVMDMAQLGCDEARDGESALQVWQPGKFSLAFLDIELPGINGLEVARRIRAQDSKIAIIMCSTNDEAETIGNAVEVDCDMFIVKPLHLDTLLSMLKVLNREGLRSNDKILVIDNMQRTRWEPRCARPIGKITLS